MRAVIAIQPQHPPINALMQRSLLQVVEVIEALSENDFTVVAVELTPSRPTIRIQSCGRCRRLIERGEAVYYSFGQRDHFGPYREGQFALGGCRIVWAEFGY